MIFKIQVFKKQGTYNMHIMLSFEIPQMTINICEWNVSGKIHNKSLIAFFSSR